MGYRGLILAAGRGSRMKGLTSDLPKCMLMVRGRPLIAWGMEALRDSGIEELAIVTGYKGDAISGDGLKKINNDEWESTNMVYSLFKAFEWSKDSTCIVVYSDIFFKPETIQKLLRAPGNLVVCNNVNWRQSWEKRYKDPLSDAESFKMNLKGELIDIGRRVSSYDEIQGQYMGILKFTSSGWSAIKSHWMALDEKSKRSMDMTSFLNSLIQSGVVVNTVDINEEWHEFDQQADLATIQ